MPLRLNCPPKMPIRPARLFGPIVLVLARLVTRMQIGRRYAPSACQNDAIFVLTRQIDFAREAAQSAMIPGGQSRERVAKAGPSAQHPEINDDL
jgi:hypothetical protein